MPAQRINGRIRSLLETKVHLCAPHSLDRIQKVFRSCFSETKYIVIADEITFAVAGKTVLKKLKQGERSNCSTFVYPGTPMLRPSYNHVETLREALLQKEDTIPVAVGSGTINDIVKRACYEAGRRYLTVPTAASVDGFTSYGASIMQDGFKKTLECPAPLAVVSDIDILRAAPSDMTAAGYGDLASKITAGADWIIADTLGIDNIVPPVWNLVQKNLRRWISQPKKLKQDNARAFRDLADGLISSGLGMQALRSTRCASGTDHLFSHVWEMENLEKNGNPVFHGFKVSLGTLSATALMEILFSKQAGRVDSQKALSKWKNWEQREQEVRQNFQGTVVLQQVLDVCRRKYLSKDQLSEKLKYITLNWETLRGRVRKQLLGYSELRDKLAAAGCPVTPGQINLTPEDVRKTCITAQMIRERYTVLDLAYELGCLEECAESIFESDLYLE